MLYICVKLVVNITNKRGTKLGIGLTDKHLYADVTGILQ